MTANISASLLAVALESGLYVNPVKIGIVVGLLLGWGLLAQWIDRDTDVVKTNREQWNLMVASGALVATFVLIMIPVWEGQMFAVGVAFWAVLAGAPALGYVMHRNGRVAPEARVCTIGHLKRALRVGDVKKRAIRSRDQRVQIQDHAGKFVEIPDDYDEAMAHNDTQDFLYDLLWRRASDADLVLSKDACRLVYKVDGVPDESPNGVSPEQGERIVRYLKKLAGLNAEEIRRPQTGKIEVGLLSQEGPPGETEIRTSGTTAGERLRLHIHKGAKVMRLPEIGLASARMDQFKTLLAAKTGLLLVAAPPENGLTTTLYAILRSHDAYMNNIHSLERRPLADVDNITQQRFDGANTDVNYARMLQTVLRREPDIIMVGECEDRETAMVASRAAGSDKKLYMGINAKDCFDGLNRYLSLLHDNALAAKALVGVLSQRLVRMLCKECREAFEPDPATLKKLNLPADKIERFYRPPTYEEGKRGRKQVCQSCQGSGYFGRTGVFELMVVDDAVRGLIAQGAPVNRIKAQCRKNRMYYLQEEALLKVIDGTTSMNEVLRCLRTNGKT